MWLSKASKLEYPDRMIFDLDPSDIYTFKQISDVAFSLKELLDSLAITCFVMTTGSRGLHVVVSLKPVHKFQEVKQLLLYRYPDKISLAIKKRKT
jgi:bifunctional non-homologous end joining protein LigD